MKRGPKPPAITKEHAARYEAGESLYKIARSLKTDETNLRNALSALGVTIRKVGSKSATIKNAAKRSALPIHKGDSHSAD